jgi:hypothetical protein
MVRRFRPWMYDVSMATWWMKGDPGAFCSACENASAFRLPRTLAR